MLMLKGATECLHMPKIDCANHLSCFLDPTDRKCVVKNSIAVLSKYDFDAIAFQGLSGALIAPIIAMQMDKTLIAVRKPNEECHSLYRVEGDVAARRYIIVDDFISSGNTVRAILNAVYYVNSSAKCLGVLCAMFLGIEYTKGANLRTDIVEDWERDNTYV